MGKATHKKYIEIVEKEFSEIRNFDCSKILLYSSYCFAPLRSFEIRIAEAAWA